MNSNSKRISALINLGDYLRRFNKNDPIYTDLQNCVKKAITINGWFTQENIEKAFSNWAMVLEISKIEKWINSYKLREIDKQRNIALILAGNIPMVGFHDIICVWVSGNNAQIKCSSKDKTLLPFMTQFLEKEAGIFAFNYLDQPFENFDAIIATGSNNSARYFKYYFGKYPHIIRKNRNGVAVLNGKETKKELESLGNDILQYFGLGCRNVSKIFVPMNYDINFIFGGLYSHSKVIENVKYANNYDYYKAIYLMSEYNFLENGFFMIKEDKEFSAPISCLYIEYYSNELELKENLENNKESIQCIVSNIQIEGKINFGSSQKPELWNYADDIDTLLFLNNLR